MVLEVTQADITEQATSTHIAITMDQLDVVQLGHTLVAINLENKKLIT